MAGSQKTEREVNQEQHNVVGSSISAGNNITITATGTPDATNPSAAKTGGDITVIGSEVKAGKDIQLNANQDINVIGAVNTQHSDKDEKSTGSAVGIQLQIGGDESGFRFKGNANFSREREKADGSAWSESVISAGDKLTVNSGHDTTIIGGQLEGNKVEMTVGNDLNIQSLQDTDNYDYEKISASISGTAGVGGASGNLSLSQTQMESNWASVTDQSGIFAKEEGYDIAVGNNTDLKGAVIASEAKDKSKNKLDTGTISFSDIENKADFDVSHVSVSIGTSGGAMPTSGAPTVIASSGSDHSTTHSAVEDGELIIRDKENQKQNVNDLSHDTANANDPLGQIFDKQKELDKIEAIEIIKDIAAQAKDVAKKADRINAQREVDKDNLPQDAITKARQELGKDATEEQVKNLAYSYAVDNQVKANNELGKNKGTMGGSVGKGIDAATSIVTGIITGDITGGLAGASAPYLAQVIKEQTYQRDEKGQIIRDDKGNPLVNTEANLVAHAILGAVVAQIQGNSAIAGGTGAMTGEAVAVIIRDKLYGKDVKELTEAEKENISALTQLATGLAIASATGGDLEATGTAVAAGKNAVENNHLDMASQVMYEYKQDYRDGLLLFGGDEKAATDYANNMMKDRSIASAIGLGIFFGGAALPETAIIGGGLSGAVNVGVQYVMNEDGSINWTDVGISSGVGAVTGGMGTGFWGTVGWNATGGAASSYLKDENPFIGGLIGAWSSSIGYGAGKLMENPLQTWLNPIANKYIHETNKGFLGITGHFTESSIPAIGGSLINSGFTEVSGQGAKDYLEVEKNENNENK
ncbi:hemagglutinin repeat-containing protein [Orbaceae bacterium ac157xtp]